MRKEWILSKLHTVQEVSYVHNVKDSVRVPGSNITVSHGPKLSVVRLTWPLNSNPKRSES